MKKFVLALIAMVTMTVSASAMGYEQARQQALFLTDKMAYELNLTDEQYDAAYEINLDYLMSVRTVDDLYSTYWERRNLDLSYILLSWQYRAFCDAAYFYRPLYWDAGFWHFGIYARYPHRDYFFFGRPAVYVEYRGGHSWRMNGGRSWYRDRHICPPRGDNHFGMRDGFRRGDYGNGFQGNPSSRTQFGTAKRAPMMNNGGGMSFGNRGNNNGSFGNANRGNNGSFGNANRGNNNGSFGTGRRPSTQRNNGSSFGTGGRESSTRSTVGGGSFGSGRGGATTSTPRSTFTPSRNEGSSSSSPSFGTGRRPSSSFGSGRGGSSFGGGSSSGISAPSKSNGSFGGSRSSEGSSFGSSRSSGGSFGSGRSSGGSFGSGRSSGGSFGGGRSSGGSFGGGRSSGGSFGGGHSGGGSFGSRR